MKIFYYIRRFWEIPGEEKFTLIGCFLISGILNLIVKLFPLKLYFELINSNPIYDQKNENLNSKIKLVNKSVRRSVKISPWECDCLNIVLTSKMLYNILGIRSKIYFILIKNEYNITKAHAKILINTKNDDSILEDTRSISFVTITI
jgi:hypothetical protein